MQINKIDNQNFTAIRLKSQRVDGVLFDRLKKDRWYRQYQEALRSQENNCFDITLNAAGKRLEATIIGPYNEEIKKNENLISYIFKQNPMKFINKMCKIADDINKNLK